MRKFLGPPMIVLALGAAACSDTSSLDAGSPATEAPATTATSAPTPGSSAPMGTVAPMPSSSTTPSGPKGEFIARADAVCTETAKKTAALKIDLNAANPADIVAQADAMDQAATFGDEALAQLRAMTTPPGDEVIVTGFWDGIAGQIELQRQVAALVRANDLQGAQTMVQGLETSGKQINAQLEAYGFVACAN